MRKLKELCGSANRSWSYFRQSNTGGGVNKSFLKRTHDGFREELPKRISVTLFGALVGAYVSRKFQERNHLQEVLEDVVDTIDKEEDALWDYLKHSDLVRKVPSMHLFSDIVWEDVNRFDENSFLLQRHIRVLREKEKKYILLKKRIRYGNRISKILDTLPIFRWFAILGPLRHQVDSIENAWMFKHNVRTVCDAENVNFSVESDGVLEPKRNNQLCELIALYGFVLHLNKGVYYHISKRSQEAVDELQQAQDLIESVDILRETNRVFNDLYDNDSWSFRENPHPSLLKGDALASFNMQRSAFMREKHRLVQSNPSFAMISQLISNCHNLLAKSFRQRAGYDLYDLDLKCLEASEEAYLKAIVFDPFDSIVKFELGLLYIDIGNCEQSLDREALGRFEKAKFFLKDAKFLHRYDDQLVTYGEALGIFNYEKNVAYDEVDFEALKKAKLLFEFSLLKRRPYVSEDNIVMINYARLLHYMGEKTNDEAYFVEALKILNDIYHNDPLYPLTLLTKGEALVSMQCFDQAECCLKLGIEVLSNISIEEDYRLRDRYQKYLSKVVDMKKQNDVMSTPQEKRGESAFCSKYKCAELRHLLFSYDDRQNSEEFRSVVELHV